MYIIVKFFYCLILLTAIVSCRQSTSDKSQHSNDVSETNRYTELLKNDVITQAMINSEADSTVDDLIFTNIYTNFHATKTSTISDCKKEFLKFTIPQQEFYSTAVIESYILDGGFITYFIDFNIAGQFSNDASKAYKRFNLPKLASIINDAENAYNSKQNGYELVLRILDNFFLDEIKLKRPGSYRIKLIRQNTDSFTVAR